MEYLAIFLPCTIRTMQLITSETESILYAFDFRCGKSFLCFYYVRELAQKGNKKWFREWKWCLKSWFFAMYGCAIYQKCLWLQMQLMLFSDGQFCTTTYNLPSLNKKKWAFHLPLLLVALWSFWLAANACKAIGRGSAVLQIRRGHRTTTPSPPASCRLNLLSILESGVIQFSYKSRQNYESKVQIASIKWI